ncbi:MAG: aldo/keto reductase [Oscillospiraceae bacterium]
MTPPTAIYRAKAEECIKSCLSSRYPREAYVINKLTMAYFKKKEDIRRFFQSQLEICGVDYFDFYLMHSQNAEIFKYFKERRAYETVLELKKAGKIRHFGISFHDRAGSSNRS